MKKSFWGYDSKEVDENIQYLESVNDTLSKKVARLSKELDEASTGAEAPWSDVGSPEAAAVYEQELQELRESVSKLSAENDVLRQENSDLGAQLLEMKHANAELAAQIEELRRQRPDEQSIIADINGVRHTVNEQLHDYVHTVMPEVHEKLELMDAAQKQIMDFCSTARDCFLDAADAILAQYDSFLEVVRKDEEVNEEYIEAEEALCHELDETIDSCLPPEPEIEFVSESEAQKVDTHRILQDIRNRSAGRESAPVKEEPKREPSIVRVPDKSSFAQAKQETPKIVPSARELNGPKQEAKGAPAARAEAKEAKQEAKSAPAVRAEAAGSKPESSGSAAPIDDAPKSDTSGVFSGALFETTDINDIMHG